MCVCARALVWLDVLCVPSLSLSLSLSHLIAYHERESLGEGTVGGGKQTRLTCPSWSCPLPTPAHVCTEPLPGSTTSDLHTMGDAGAGEPSCPLCPLAPSRLLLCDVRVSYTLSDTPRLRTGPWYATRKTRLYVPCIWTPTNTTSLCVVLRVGPAFLSLSLSSSLSCLSLSLPLRAASGGCGASTARLVSILWPKSFGARTHHFISQSMLHLVWDGELFPSLSPSPRTRPKSSSLTAVASPMADLSCGADTITSVVPRICNLLVDNWSRGDDQRGCG